MLDKDLAILYEVSTKALNQAVRRHLERFPEDFMFRLTNEETQNWRSQFVTSNSPMLMSLRRNPYAFTENGVAMLSSVLKSKRAIQVNIHIMRAFTRLRQILASNDLIRQKIEELEKKYDKHDDQFKVVFEAIRKLLEEPRKNPPKKSIGFHEKY